MATINSENAKQIRNPMQIYIHLLAGASGTITGFNVPAAPIKSYDTSLKNTSWAMRSIADLAGDGFPLDGSVEWFEQLTPSEANGKLGLRGNTGANINVSFTASSTIASVTVASQNVDTITVGGVSYPSTGLNVIPINAASATLQFTLIDSDERIMIDYIIPGAEFSITNDNLVSCNLALRSDLSVQNHTWEESEIEVSMYYPYDISSTFAYIQSDFPITYQAGYDSDLSEIRRFYLSEPITEENHVITIRGVDASHWLDDKKMNEQWLETYPGNARESIYNKFVQSIQASGITLVHKQNVSGAESGAIQRAVLPEMTTRDFVSEVMNLTLNYKRSGTYYGIQFVDAGIPTVEFGDGKIFGKTWMINKSDCADWVETYEQNIARIQETDEERRYNETLTPTWQITHLGGDNLPEGHAGLATVNGNQVRGWCTDDPNTDGYIYANQIFEASFDGYYYGVRAQYPPTMHNHGYRPPMTTILIAPSYGIFKATKSSQLKVNTYHEKYVVLDYKNVIGYPVAFTGGVSSFANPNNLPGITINYEPFIHGHLTDANGASVFNYQSLFNRSIRTGSFTFKGDPRMQPLDYLIINNDTNDGRRNITARITSIELSHEGGGTMAVIGWHEWS